MVPPEQFEAIKLQFVEHLQREHLAQQAAAQQGPHSSGAPTGSNGQLTHPEQGSGAAHPSAGVSTRDGSPQGGAAKPPLHGKGGSAAQGKPGGGSGGSGQFSQYPTVSAAQGQGSGSGSGGAGEGGQGGTQGYPPFLQQQNQLLARHLQQPVGLPLNRLTPQQTQQVGFQCI